MRFRVDNGVLLRYIPDWNDDRITLPDEVTEISTGAFTDCKKLRGVTLPEGLKHIAPDAFSYCEQLSDIRIPGGVRRIGNRAFYGCAALNEVKICEGVRYIGDRAFGQCRNIGRTELPQSVRRIGEAAFVRGTELCWYARGYRLMFATDGCFAELSAYTAAPSWLTFSVLPAAYRLACAPLGCVYDPMIADWTRQHISEVMERVFPEDIKGLSALLAAHLPDAALTERYLDSAIAYTQRGGSPEPQMMLTRYRHTLFGEEATSFSL